MNKGIVVGITFLFLGTCITPSVAVDTVKNPSIPTSNGKTLYVGGTGEGNYSSIQDAIDNASNGDTVFVYDDSSPYEESIRFIKSINLIGENKETTIINNSCHITADRVKIQGFTIKNGQYGIYIDSDYNNISGNIITSNRANGIDLDLSNGNNIIGNNISYSGDVCINLVTSNNNNISNNNINSNKESGIDLFYSKNNNIIGNTVTNAEYGISLLLFSNNNKISDNIIISNEYYGVYIQQTIFNTITGNKISNNVYGIMLGYSSTNKIKSNNISNNDYGIYIEGSSINFILKNNFLYNEKDAFFIDSFRNRWRQNYWDESLVLPKLIIGEIYFVIPLSFRPFIIHGPWLNIDWRPALKPYDIGV